MSICKMDNQIVLLQNLEIELIRENVKLNDLKERRKELKEQIEEFEEKLSFLKLSLKEKENRVRDLENFIEYKKERLKEFSSKRDGVGSRKEFKELLRQIAKTEDDIIRANEEIEKLKPAFEEDRKKVGKEIEEIEANLSVLSNHSKVLKDEICKRKEKVVEIEKELSSLREEVDHEILHFYDSYKDRYRGLVFSDVSSGSCEGCGMTFSPAEFRGVIKEIEKGKIAKCPYCGRFLFNKCR